MNRKQDSPVEALEDGGITMRQAGGHQPTYVRHYETTIRYTYRFVRTFCDTPLLVQLHYYGLHLILVMAS